MVGQGDVVELEVGELPAAPGLLEALQAIPGVQQVDATDGMVRLIAEDGNAALPEIIRQMNMAGARVTNLAVQEPNLEAVFLHLTGRALRD